MAFGKQMAEAKKLEPFANEYSVLNIVSFVSHTSMSCTWIPFASFYPFFLVPDLSTVWELGQLALRFLAWGLFLLPLLSLCKLWLRCVRQPRRHGLGASWGEGIKAFPASWQRVEQRQGWEQVCFDENTAAFPLWLPSGKVLELG